MGDKPEDDMPKGAFEGIVAWPRELVTSCHVMKAWLISLKFIILNTCQGQSLQPCERPSVLLAHFFSYNLIEGMYNLCHLLVSH